MVKAGREVVAQFCKTQEICMDCVLFGEAYVCRSPESMTDSEVEAACELIYDNQALPSLPSQEAKADIGKPRLSLVPSQIIRDIARVREYGNDNTATRRTGKQLSRKDTGMRPIDICWRI